MRLAVFDMNSHLLPTHRMNNSIVGKLVKEKKQNNEMIIIIFFSFNNKHLFLLL